MGLGRMGSGKARLQRLWKAQIDEGSARERVLEGAEKLTNACGIVEERRFSAAEGRKISAGFSPWGRILCLRRIFRHAGGKDTSFGRAVKSLKISA
jgi:hypothetical protein